MIIFYKSVFILASRCFVFMPGFFCARGERTRLLKKTVFLGAAFLFCLHIEAGTEWKIEKSKHFLVYYQQGADSFIKDVVRKAESYYDSITDYLGFKRIDFWTWDNRCKIYFYQNSEEYQKNTNTASWSKGNVHVKKKEITTYVKRDQFFEHILPHELGHIVFREFVGFDKKLPLWVDEGVAVLQEGDRSKHLSVARGLVEGGGCPSLAELSGIEDYGKISPREFYSQAASIIEFLLQRFGRNSFVDFCRLARDRQEWQEAIKKVYGFDSLDKLEEAWAAWVVNEG